jgi:hypothetical protein
MFRCDDNFPIESAQNKDAEMETKEEKCEKKNGSRVGTTGL